MAWPISLPAPARGWILPLSAPVSPIHGRHDSDLGSTGRMAKAERSVQLSATGEAVQLLQIAASKRMACELLAARNQTAMLASWPSPAGAVSSSNHTPPSAR